MRSLLIFSHTGSSSDQSEAETKGEPLYKSLREAATPLNEIDIIICIINNYDCVSVRLGSGWFFELESASDSASESDTVCQRVGVGAWATGASHRAELFNMHSQRAMLVQSS